MRGMTLSNLMLIAFMGALSLTLSGQDVFFVNHAAAGSNDGSTWENAFTDLSSALDTAADGDMIWIAKGTYVPDNGSGDSTSTFSVTTSARIFGGFAGTENNLGERDIPNNRVYLSGDQLGNDDPNNVSLNRADNSWHVMTVAPAINDPVQLSDLTFQGGTAKMETDINLNHAGGGLIAFGQVRVFDCYFQNNSGRAGASIALFDAGASNSEISGSAFIGNSSNSQSAGIFMQNTNAVNVNQCHFEKNLITRGVIYPLRSTNTSITECNFQENSCTPGSGNFGGVIFSWNSVNTVMYKCSFDDNSCGNGGVSYVDGRELQINQIAAIWRECSFGNNTADDWGGGAIYGWRATQLIEECDFNGNSAPNTGGALYLGGNSKNTTIRRCEFTNNIANGGWGGAHASYGDTSTLIAEQNYYEGNMAVTSGGAVTNGFGNDATYTECQFEANTAQFGGAGYSQNDSTKTVFSKCSFFGNAVSGFGGALNLNSGAVDNVIEQCYFELNVSQNSGGGLSVSDPDNTDAEQTRLLISHSKFVENISEEQAGAIYISDAQVAISNSEISSNSSLATGTGGAISHNGSSGDSSNLFIINSTLADNFGAFANGISSWTDDVGTGKVILQNTILNHGTQDWVIEGGTPEIVSVGGNLVSDNAIGGMFISTNDLVGEDPLFVDADNGDYNLTDGSPCVNTGISVNTSPFDLNGNPRVGEVDKGSYENQNVVSNRDIKRQSLPLVIAPNPVYDQTTLYISPDKPQMATLEVYDVNGQLVHSKLITLLSGVNKHYLDCSELISGQYVVEIKSQNVMGSRVLIKQ
jgi:hypothetical protein